MKFLKFISTAVGLPMLVLALLATLGAWISQYSIMAGLGVVAAMALFAVVVAPEWFRMMEDRFDPIVAIELNPERGATAVEYGMLVALIAAVIVAFVVVLGEPIADFIRWLF